MRCFARLAATSALLALVLLAMLAAVAACSEKMVLAHVGDTPLFEEVSAADIEEPVTTVVEFWETFACEFEWMSFAERIDLAGELIDKVCNLVVFKSIFTV